MYVAPHDSGLDIFMFGIPLIALLVFGYFRLDEVFTRKQPSPQSPKRQSHKMYSDDEEAMQTDPDGRPWEKPLARRY